MSASNGQHDNPDVASYVPTRTTKGEETQAQFQPLDKKTVHHTKTLGKRVSMASFPSDLCFELYLLE